MNEIMDCIIIGGGPAGLTVGIYLKRNNISSIVLEKSSFGGMMVNTSKIENYPGFTSINGADLAFNMYEHAQEQGVKLVNEAALEVIKENDYFLVKTKRHEYKTKYLIIAMGLINKKLGLTNEDKFKNISWCAICDGALYKNKTVAIVGGGNSAIEEALYLSSICEKVYLIHRRDDFRADNVLVKKIKEQGNVELCLNETITSLDGDDLLKEITLSSGKKLNVDGLFEYIGQEPNLSLLDNLSLEKSNGFISVDGNYKTSLDNVYAIGDVIDKPVRQISTAVGDGANVAIIISRKMRS